MSQAEHIYTKNQTKSNQTISFSDFRFRFSIPGASIIGSGFGFYWKLNRQSDDHRSSQVPISTSMQASNLPRPNYAAYQSTPTSQRNPRPPATHPHLHCRRCIGDGWYGGAPAASSAIATHQRPYGSVEQRIKIRTCLDSTSAAGGLRGARRRGEQQYPTASWSTASVWCIR